MSNNKTIIWVSGLVSSIFIAAILWITSEFAITFYVSSSDWLIFALLIWLIMIQWFKAHDLDLKDDARMVEVEDGGG